MAGKVLNIKVCNPHLNDSVGQALRLHSGLTGKCDEVAYLSFTQRLQQLIMKQVVIISIFLIFAFNCLGQKGIINGIIINGIDRTPSQYITIMLMQGEKELGGTISDEQGKFEFKDVSEGNYELNFSFIGYPQHLITNVDIKSDSTIILKVAYPCPQGNSKSEKICPYGHKNDIVPILFGLPSLRMMRKEKRGKVYLGGCIVTECDPSWYCKIHKLEF